MKKRNNRRNYLKYTGLGFQITGTVLLGVLAGQWLDSYYNIKNNIFTIVLSLLMIFVAMYQLIRMLK